MKLKIKSVNTKDVFTYIRAHKRLQYLGFEGYNLRIMNPRRVLIKPIYGRRVFKEFKVIIRQMGVVTMYIQKSHLRKKPVNGSCEIRNSVRLKDMTTWYSVSMFLLNNVQVQLDYTRILTRTKEQFIKRYAPIWWMLLQKIKFDFVWIFTKEIMVQ